MNPNGYQELCRRTESNTEGAEIKDKNFRRLLHGVIGICTEAGELQDIIKKHMFYGTDLDPVHVQEEGGDLLWYIALVLNSLGLSMESTMEANIAKLRKRYPDSFSCEEAIKRDF